MMKKTYLIIALCLICLQLSAPEWSISYPGEFPLGFTRFIDGFTDIGGVTFLAGQEGPDESHPDAIFMRIDPNGTHSEFKYRKTGFHSIANCIIEMPNHNLFVSGNLYDAADDYLMVLILDKHLNLLYERQYEKGVEAISFKECKATIDGHNHVIVTTAVAQNNEYNGIDYHGAFFKFDDQGKLLNYRYLIEDYPDPLYFIMDYRPRQMWYKEDSETLLCLAPGYGGILSFITFDSSFNYIEEYPIWNDSIEKSDHTICRMDSYTDYWYNENEALFFSGICDNEHNRLRVAHVNTQGEILELIRLNERADTIDDPAVRRCMAAVSDSMFYFSFHYHEWKYYPGFACVYQLNDNLEIVGRHVDDDHNCYRTSLILPTADYGCITVNDSCSYEPLSHQRHPVIKKLTSEDFEHVPLFIEGQYAEHGKTSSMPYPNPADKTLNIPLPALTQKVRCQITDPKGIIIIDRIVESSSCLLQFDVSQLKTGLYLYRVYTPDKTLLHGKFMKK
jgi:hypothetical protein